MKDRSRNNRFEGMDREWLLKLFLCYIQWCIGELSEDDRIELERVTPRLQVEFGCSGFWYEVIEEGCGLPASGRVILVDCWRDMREEVSVKDFVSEFARRFIEKAARMRNNKRRPTLTRRGLSH